MNGDFDTIWPEIERQVHGWLWRDKAEAMWNLVLDEKPQRMVEIGCWAGRSLILQALALKKLGGTRIIYGIDPYDNAAAMIGDGGDKVNCEWVKTHDFGEVFRQLLHNLLTFEVTAQVRLINVPSGDLLNCWQNEKFDVVHIDGNHSEVSSQIDSEWALMMTNPGGHIWLDDTHWPSQANTIKFLRGECEMIREIGSSMLFRKR